MPIHSGRSYALGFGCRSNIRFARSSTLFFVLARFFSSAAIFPVRSPPLIEVAFPGSGLDSNSSAHPIRVFRLQGQGSRRALEVISESAVMLSIFSLSPAGCAAPAVWMSRLISCFSSSEPGFSSLFHTFPGFHDSLIHAIGLVCLPVQFVRTNFERVILSLEMCGTSASQEMLFENEDFFPPFASFTPCCQAT